MPNGERLLTQHECLAQQKPLARKLRTRRYVGKVFGILLSIPIAVLCLCCFIGIFWLHHLLFAPAFEYLEDLDWGLLAHYPQYVGAALILWLTIYLYRFWDHWSSVGRKNAFSRTTEEIFSLARWVYWLVKKTFGLLEDLMEDLGRWLYRKTVYNVQADR